MCIRDRPSKASELQGASTVIPISFVNQQQFQAILRTNTLHAQPMRGLKVFAKNSNENESTMSAEEFAKFDPNQVPNSVHDYVKPGKERVVGYWLLLTAGAVFFMIVLGGYTRLSKSGLSMTKWKPIGYRYPRNIEQWEEEFENYKKYPEYQLANKGMTLEQFKPIFFVEFFHRLWGNIIGGLFTLPMVYFMGRGYIRPKLRNRLVGLLLLGGTQGLIGWWMVKSGMQAKPEYQSRPRVSTYRLFVHLNTAIFIYSVLFWQSLNLLRTGPERFLTGEIFKSSMSVRGKMIGILHLIALNILSGALVAGIDAGKVHNTWPDMNGAFIPPDYLSRTPLWRNFTENMGNVQFNHRYLGYFTYAFVMALFIKSRKMNLGSVTKRSIWAMTFFVNYQLILGITLLLRIVPVPEAVTHQGNALVCLSSALFVLHTCRKPNKQALRYLKYLINNHQSTVKITTSQSVSKQQIPIFILHALQRC
eukprot:TRINITY_DN1140_c0_g1_i3.p1 TRINITY_DN1140_c0_g1~~TRINITY_DN1140_c0_g1_i3.p1  ORF type:complete len:476 (+),score=60.82 TRINITY_DN1140_c0_g1_i3:64-1491(+)